MKVISVIPARGGSKGIPLKNIVSLNGEPLISYTKEASKQSNYRGIGLSEMVDAIENKREQGCNGELALHVLDIIESTMIAAKNKTEVNMRSSCHKPSPLKDGEIQILLK